MRKARTAYIRLTVIFIHTNHNVRFQKTSASGKQEGILETFELTSYEVVFGPQNVTPSEEFYVVFHLRG